MKHRYIYLLIVCPLVSFGQITGQVWQDHSADGRRNKFETGAKSIHVRAYDAGGKLITETASDQAGRYHLSVTAGERIRVEFSGLSAQQQARQSLLRFATAPTEIDLGVTNLGQYTGTRVRAVQPIYVNGDYTDRATDTLSALVAFTATPGTSSATKLQRLANPAQVGSLWGLAYDRSGRRLFAAALAKRHSGFGPLGAGGIYLAMPDSGTTKPFLDLDKLGIATAPAHLPRDLSGGLASVSHDSLMFSLVGKCSLGGLDVSDDGRHLFVMNLFDRRLYRINLPTTGVVPRLSDITSYSLPTLTDKAGDFRPFAVKYHDGKVYVGVVNDATRSKQASDLKATVLAFDPATETFTEVFAARLDYPRGVLDYGVSGWQPWTDDYNRAVVPNSANWLIYPQPMLADIEFDTDGSMILGLMDRLGHQTGDGQSFRPTGSPTLQAGRGLAGGDVLRAAWRNDHYELERNGRAGGLRTAGHDNGQGPAGGEFYTDDQFTADGLTWHHETGMGGLALLPETGELLVATREPVAGQYLTGGVKWLSNQTGRAAKGLGLFPADARAGYYWKTNSVGDVELITDTPPTEIGDRVWHDLNENGMQDADEPGLSDVQLQLYQNGRQLAATMTDAEGYYRFEDKDLPGGLKPHADYEIRIPLKQGRYPGLYLPSRRIQQPPVATDMPTEIDNNAVAESDIAVIRVKTASMGESLHGLDAGLRLPGQGAEKAVSRLSLTPNPATSQTEVNYRGYDTTGPVTVSLRDGSGRLFQTLTGALKEGHFRRALEVHQLMAGTYFVTITEGSQTTSSTLLKP
jgi:hypothetical protein